MSFNILEGDIEFGTHPTPQSVHFSLETKLANFAIMLLLCQLHITSNKK